MQRLTKILIPLFAIIIIPLTVSAKIYFFNLDYAQFRGFGGKTKLEVYSSFSEKNLNYNFQSGKYSGNVLLNISFTDLAKSSVIFDQTYNVPVSLTDTSKTSLSENQIIKLDYNLSPGTYQLKGIASDGNNKDISDSISYDIVINDFSGTAPVLSDIQLATAITNSKDTSGLFYKNTLDVLPNPNSLFGNKLKTIYYYIELYNLNNLTSGENLKVDLHILDVNMKERLATSKSLKKGTDSRVDIGKFSVDSFPSGAYILKYDLLAENGSSVSKEKKFYIYNTGISSTVFNDDNTNDFLKSEFGSMTPEAADQEFDKLKYIISKRDKEAYAKLSSVDDKRKFLFNFWRAIGNTPANKIRINYFKRIDEANKQFTESFQEGWKTDRGRLYITYGPPDNIDRHPFEPNSHAYEVWKWEKVEGGAEADFVERESQTGIYTLVNSTLRTEVKFPEWVTYYKISGF